MLTDFYTPPSLNYRLRTSSLVRPLTLDFPDNFENDELGIPTEEGSRTISSALGSHLLWNKVDIAFETWKPVSKPSQLLVCPSGAPSDEDYSKSGDDNGGDSNGNAGILANTP